MSWKQSQTNDSRKEKWSAVSNTSHKSSKISAES